MARAHLVASARLVVAVATLSVACEGRDRAGLRIATIAGGIASFAAGPTRLYARAYPDRSFESPLWLYEICPQGAYRKLLETPGFMFGPPRLVVAGTQLYFSLLGPDGGIGAFDTATGVQRTVVPSGFAFELLADSRRVYWVNSRGDSIISAIAIDGTGETVVGRGSGIFDDDQALYWQAGDQIVRASKGDLANTRPLATAKSGFTSAAAFGGNVYWAPGDGSNQVLTIPADGTGGPRTLVTVGALASNHMPLIVAIQPFAGEIDLAVADRLPGECCAFTPRLVRVDSGAGVDIAGADDIHALPYVAAGSYGLFWTTGFDVYKVR